MANIDITGANGSVTYTTLVSGTNAPLVANVVIVRGQIGRPTAVTTRPGALMERLTVGLWRGAGVLRVISTDDGTPPLITATHGVLNIILRGTQAYNIPIVFVNMGGLGYTSLQGETPQAIDYEWRASGLVTTDTVARVAT